MTILEAAGVLLITLSLLIAAVGIVDYLRLASSVSDVVRHGTLLSSVKPLSLEDDGEIAWDGERIAALMPELSRQIEQEFSETFPDIRDDQTRFRYEIRIGRIDVNPRNGELIGITFPHALTASGGSLSLPAALDRETSLTDRMWNLLRDTGALAAIPSGALGTPGADQYLPSLGVMGVRGFYSFDRSLTATVVRTLGVSESPVVFDALVVPLRGEVQ